MDTFLQQATNAISLGAIYALFALGYALVFSILGVLNLAHSAIFAWGALIGLIVMLNLGGSIPIALIAAIVTCGLISMALEVFAFRPLRQRNAARISQLISSIGAAIFLVSLAQIVYIRLYNNSEAAFPRAMIPADLIVIEALNIRVTLMRVIVLLIALALMVVLQLLVTRSRIGQQMRAVSFNQRIAALLGINVGRIYLFTFFLAGGLAGVAGLFYGLVFIQVDPFIGDDVALIGLTAIVLGGMGSIQGAVVGGFLVATIQTISTVLGGSDYRNAVVFLLLFLFLLFRPQGLFGQPESSRA
ncbi:MAG: branched-chain amino acid ABC transporter permease [Anaerolineae bacterium]|jgi:branched-chain amino acid transport system permease protein|nr:branched-chain amino acid ABC transporter permease [Anaerolineae bacterium]